MAENATGPSTLGVTSQATLLVPARDGRQKLLIQNPSGSGVNLIVGYGSDPTAANGFVVTPGGTLDETVYEGAIHGLHDGSGTAQMPWVEVW